MPLPVIGPKPPTDVLTQVFRGLRQRALILGQVTMDRLAVLGDVSVAGALSTRTVLFPFRTVSVRQINSQSIPASAFTKIAYDTVIQDPQNRWSTANSSIVLSARGLYVFQGAFSWNPPAATVTSIASIFATPPGGAAQELQRGIQWVTTVSTTIVIPFCFFVLVPSNGYFTTANAVPVGSTIDIRGFQSSAGALTTNPSSAASGPDAYLNVAFLGGG